MINDMNTSRNILTRRCCKGKDFAAQMKTVFEAFRRAPATMLMVSIETGILRANICRYVAEWRQQGKICKHHEGMCLISKCKAGYYTTDPSLFPAQIQQTEINFKN